ncbi:DUF2268 domain-containing putative Zn-dependent protease [Pullulanibacillus sp. KACC 23026]|uniref:DUF2268 domain-containing putative Zn-dependent protease n=1 Tax=Pullulanibacillus sp. KACC 23026 TaxID=3028315 RepID=UPI0023B1D3FB|nr:DUF2268 domain-containing putative Zn-dependent protease [Pullulanibacillus sp. KACC 23026]WEG11182.1 DUF2268 domain-containing putative Zn-dependent protease [Pullulanibacillus sp. KACC 23026]
MWEEAFKQQIKFKGEQTDLYMFGDEEQEIPLWAGYSLGHYLVKWYLDNNDNSIKQLLLLSSEAFLD